MLLCNVLKKTVLLYKVKSENVYLFAGIQFTWKGGVAAMMKDFDVTVTLSDVLLNQQVKVPER